MRLRASVTASPKDEDRDDVAFVYCYDAERQYCVSLARQPGWDFIELMVQDQLNTRVRSLAVRLVGSLLYVTASPDTAAELDGNQLYQIEIINNQEVCSQLVASLQVIFLGKEGLSITTS